MRELIAPQKQLSQETTQFLANNNELDPTMQKVLETQSQLLQGMATQMINMGDNSSQGFYDTSDSCAVYYALTMRFGMGRRSQLYLLPLA